MKTAISIPGEALDEYVAHHDPVSSTGRRSSVEAVKRRARGRVAAAALILGISGVPASADVTTTDQVVIERILELRSEAARLAMGLAPEARAELERRLWEVEQEPQVETKLSPTAATPSGDVSPRVEQEPTPEALVLSQESSQVATDSSPPLPTQPAAASLAARSGCNAFVVFDTNSDGLINAADRYWRYLFLWRDHNQDGRMTDKEIENPFDLEISGLRVDLRFFTKKDGSLGDVHLGEYVVFERVSSQGVSRGNLVVEATRMQRSDGPKILDASGSVLEGFQVLRTGMAVVSDGEKLLLHCP